MTPRTRGNGVPPPPLTAVPLPTRSAAATGNHASTAYANRAPVTAPHRNVSAMTRMGSSS